VIDIDARTLVLGLLGVVWALHAVGWLLGQTVDRAPLPGEPGAKALRCRTCGARSSPRLNDVGDFWCVRGRRAWCRTCVLSAVWRDTLSMPSPLYVRYNYFLLTTPSHKISLWSGDRDTAVVVAELGDVPCERSGCGNSASLIDLVVIDVYYQGRLEWGETQAVQHCQEHPSVVLTAMGRTPVPPRSSRYWVDTTQTRAAVCEDGRWRDTSGAPVVPDGWRMQPQAPMAPERHADDVAMGTAISWPRVMVTDAHRDSQLPRAGANSRTTEWRALTEEGLRSRYWLSRNQLPVTAGEWRLSSRFAITGRELDEELDGLGYTYRSHHWDGYKLRVTYTTCVDAFRWVLGRNRYVLTLRPASTEATAALARIQSRIAPGEDPAVVLATQSAVVTPLALQLIAHTDTTLDTLTEMLTLAREWSETPHTESATDRVLAGCRAGVYTTQQLTQLLASASTEA
jgi:hypothetical protein